MHHADVLRRDVVDRGMTRLQHPLRVPGVSYGDAVEDDLDALRRGLHPGRPRVIPDRLLARTGLDPFWHEILLPEREFLFRKQPPAPVECARRARIETKRAPRVVSIRALALLKLYSTDALARFSLLVVPQRGVTAVL
ncbi:MAG: hypothetical protein BAJATHORv1_140010 [Candidatus Thorarchaeota archaeon]|nr:MAG: hypothetical protein BAJATHORv1_140010 [Candidatus Thorarchaeota archaeon]